MAEVIGRFKVPSRDEDCNNCGSIVRYYKSDVVYCSGSDIERKVVYYYQVICPSCKVPISVPPWDLS